MFHLILFFSDKITDNVAATKEIALLPANVTERRRRANALGKKIEP